MLLAEIDPPRSHHGAAAEPEAAPINAKTPIPSYDPFSDEELWRRVGEVIARAARRSPPTSKP